MNALVPIAEAQKYLADWSSLNSNAKEVAEVINANGGLVGSNLFDLDGAKVPTGGGATWEVGGEEGSKEIDGVIVFYSDGRTYWKDAFSGEGMSPDCQSSDSITGVGNPGGECAKCPMAEFGSAAGRKAGEKGKGQACKQQRTLLIVRQHDVLPIRLNVPPSSLQEAKRYFLRLASRHPVKRFYEVVTRLTLVKEKSGDGITYSKIKFDKLVELSPEQNVQMAGMSKALREAFVKATK